MFRINSLTGLRFIAAYIVVLSHTFNSITSIRDMGGVSVQLFFILSGFVMYINYANKIRIQHISFKKFMLLRLIRLYPVYFLSITLYLIVKLRYTNFASLDASYLTSILMLQSWFIKSSAALRVLNPPAWSVSDEIFFYICFFIIIYLLSNRKIISGIFLYFLSWVLIISIIQPVNSASFKWLWYINPSYRICDFLIGCLVAIIFNVLSKQVNKKSSSFTKIFMTIFELASLIIVFGSQFLLPLDIYWWSSILTTLVSAFVIFIFSLEIGYIAKLFSSKVMVYLGDASYSLYLFHFLILFEIIDPLTPKYHFPGYIVISSKLITPVIVSMIIYSLFEHPIYTYLKQHINSKNRIKV